MSTRYTVNLGDVESLYVVEADTPFSAILQAQHDTGSLDRCFPGPCYITVTVGVTLVPECQTWGDACPDSCECAEVICGGYDVDVPVVLMRPATGQMIVSLG